MESVLRQRATTGAPGDMEMGEMSTRQSENAQNDGTKVQSASPDSATDDNVVPASDSGVDLVLDTRFKMRHIATMVFGEHHLIRLIPIGLSIETGTLFESGYSLWIGGPVCLILAYLWTGSIQYAFTVGNIYTGLDKLTDS